MAESLMNGISLSGQNLGVLLMKCQIICPYVAYNYLHSLTLGHISGLHHSNKFFHKASWPGRARRDQLSEFHRLIEQQIPRLRRYARALTRNRERADDLVQDTLGRALIKEEFWQPGTNLRAWLFTIMHNQNVNNVRRDVRESGALDIEGISVALPATTDPTASRQMFELERALAQLPLEQRQVILLVGLEGMSYQDAAGILVIPVGTVSSRLSRGRDALRKLLDMEDRPSAIALPHAA
jgi:RNA polymerase sigma-70 factor, ECF subfamily